MYIIGFAHPHVAIVAQSHHISSGKAKPQICIKYPNQSQICIYIYPTSHHDIYISTCLYSSHHLHHQLLVVKLQSCPFGKNLPGPVWYTIYPHLPVVKGASSDPSINQPTNGKRTSMGKTNSVPQLLGGLQSPAPPCRRATSGAPVGGKVLTGKPGFSPSDVEVSC